MKFDIGDVNSYQGEDLILMMGCPGSRWSHVHRVISENPAINNTDWSEEKSWTFMSEDVYGGITNMGNHMGSYWGPGNMYGKDFHRLNELPKEKIVADFMDAYENWDKVKIIKSHWFAYHIEYLHSLFPKAKLLFCYSNEIESFYRWHKCGGWGIGYANYAWYENDTKLLKQIKEENYNILKFCIDRDLDLKYVPRSEIWNQLNIPHELDDDPYFKCKVTSYSGGHLTDFTYLTPHNKPYNGEKP